MRCLIKCYCGKCKEEYTDYTDKTGRLLPACPNCEQETDFEQIYELETLQVG